MITGGFGRARYLVAGSVVIEVYVKDCSASEALYMSPDTLALTVIPSENSKPNQCQGWA